MTEMLKKEFSRKSFVKGGGAMVVGFSMVGAALAPRSQGGPKIRTHPRGRPTSTQSTRG